MARLLPDTRHSSASRLVNEVINQTTIVGKVDRFVFTRAMRELDDLQKVDVVAAEGMRAILFAAAGQDESAEASLLNAERNGGFQVADEARFKYLVNRMRFAEARAVGKRLLSNRGPLSLSYLAELMAALGGFRTVAQALDRSMEANEVVQATDIIPLTRRAVTALDQAGVSDVQIELIVDLFGEIAQRRNLVWMNSLPDFSVLTDEEGGPLVSIGFRFDATPREAAEMNWELVERIVDADVIISGFAMTFIGQPVGADGILTSCAD